MLPDVLMSKPNGQVHRAARRKKSDQACQSNL